MKKYTYYFEDGTKSEVEVSDELYEKLIEMDKSERRQNYNQARHTVPLSVFTYEGEEFADPNSDLCEKLMKNEETARIQSAISTLTGSQQELVRLVYYDKKKIIDIAAEQGVSQQAISDRLNRIKGKLKKLLA